MCSLCVNIFILIQTPVPYVLSPMLFYFFYSLLQSFNLKSMSQTKEEEEDEKKDKEETKKKEEEEEEEDLEEAAEDVLDFVDDPNVVSSPSPSGMRLDWKLNDWSRCSQTCGRGGKQVRKTRL